MKLVTFNLSNSRAVAVIKNLCPPAIYNYLYKRLIVKDIPNKEAYKPHYQPWREPSFVVKTKKVRPYTGLTEDKLYFIEYFLRETIYLRGNVAEAGVWRGGSAKFIAEILNEHPEVKKIFYLFDSFEGMQEVTSSIDRHGRGDFSNTSVTSVSELLFSELNNIKFIFKKGWIPQTFVGISSETFSFVHIDLDLYQSILDLLSYFYPRLCSGGIIVFDDYGYASCPGAKKAVDDFFNEMPEAILVLHTGQAVIIKK